MRIEYFQLIDRVQSIREDVPGLVATARVPAERRRWMTADDA